MTGEGWDIVAGLAPDLGLSGLVAAGLWAILTGRLVTRRHIEDLVGQWRETNHNLTEQNATLQEQIVTVLMPLATTTHSTMSAVQRNAGLVEPSPPPALPDAPEVGP